MTIIIAGIFALIGIALAIYFIGGEPNAPIRLRAILSVRSGINGTEVGRSYRKNVESGHLSADGGICSDYRKFSHGSKSQGW